MNDGTTMTRTAITLIFLFSAFSELLALPLYTARSGRICDTCHATPFQHSKQKEWNNPDFSKRKCNLSCSTCHVDTGGGGLRKVSGRYYAMATLPQFNFERRPYWDSKRDLRDYLKKLVSNDGHNPKNTSYALQTLPSKPGGDIPTHEYDNSIKKLPASPAPPPASSASLPDYNFKHKSPPFYTFEDPFVMGNAINADPEDYRGRVYTPIFGIYGNLNADPFLTIGGDIRAAYVKTPVKEVSFPMQAQLGIALHPVEHVTLSAEGGYLGQAVKPGEESIPLEERAYIKQASLMVHELPYQAYAKAGAFLPQFGLRHDDHTGLTRKNFEMDYSHRYNTVYGAEIGMAPNYPYIALSGFTNMGAEFEETGGSGAALAFGWRDMLYGGGLSFLVKQREHDFGIGRGNFKAAAIDYYINLGRIMYTIPIVFMGEFVVGERENRTGKTTNFGHFFEINYLVANGFNLRINEHYIDPDTSEKNNENGRFAVGLDYTPIPALRFTVEQRYTWLIPQDDRWRQGSFINPYDMSFENQFVVITHLYF